MVRLPKYYNLCPCVDLYYGPAQAIFIMCVRRWTADGKVRTDDGTYLWDRADRVFALPMSAEPLGEAVTTLLAASRQVGKHLPDLAKPVHEAVNVPNADIFSDTFYPLVVWTHRDDVTPYEIGAAVSQRGSLEPVLIPKDASNKVLGSAMLAFLGRVRQLHWDDE